ncbi:hypothetical protein BC940DRAFT_296725 [Gongronella butleri]|nr:hypothetical protein BC940DRAFT_296725 [Gongronella butleri]
MSKSAHIHQYAGLLIYRAQRNIEFLLLNDSFAKKKHWFCPKGKLLDQDDEAKCALREAVEATGLSPNSLLIEEGFKVEVKYLSGTTPKRVIYFLAQLVDHHARLLPGAEGVHLQWCNQHVASEKSVFKSMQDVFKHAHAFIEIKRRRQPSLHGKKFSSKSGSSYTNPPPGKRAANGLAGQDKSQLDQTSSINTPGTPPSWSSGHAFRAARDDASAHTRANGNNTHSTPEKPNAAMSHTRPLFKTRLCERFETDGECPYGSRCTFAHGIQELREFVPLAGQAHHHHHAHDNVKEKTRDEHALHKTRLCERFMKDGFCQYGPKCHFAHGKEELKQRPQHARDPAHLPMSAPLPSSSPSSF